MTPRGRNGEHPVYDAHVLPEYTVELDINGKYLDVSDDFCKVLGYSRKELIGKRFDSITAPGTINTSVVFELFLRSRYMHGIWVFLNRARTTRIVVRYEAWLRVDSRIECKMELLGAGA
jgi:PAS domain S-box-containing protein